ncbi:MAG TPA: type VI secretion system tube protein Hcp [Acetobacteraceae bacterium]|nr:type VI secretion system tube protein Hcp [Acetobacteraceae bacterium]
MAIYMKLGTITGSVTAAGYQNWIKLETFRWGFSANTSFSQAGAEVTVREVVVTMRADKCSPLIVNAGVSRTVLSPVQIKFTTTGAGSAGVILFLSYELTGSIITNYAVDGPAEGHPVESLTLNFTKITETFNPRDAGLTGSPSTVTYDVKAATSS